MHTEIEKISPSRIKLVLTANDEDKAVTRKKVLRKYTAEKEIKGYRKGKAPEARVAAEFAANIEADAFTAMFENAVDAAVRENNLQVHERVSIDDAKEADGGLTVLGVVLDLVPEFDLPQYEGIPVDGVDTAVTDDDIAVFLERLRQIRAKYLPLDEGIPAAKNDFLTISYEGFADGGTPLIEAVPDAGPLAASPKTWCSLENDKFRIPGVPEALLGAVVGETRNVAVKFPDDYSKESLRGGDVEYKVTVIEGRRMVLPELDEAFAKESKFDSLAALRDSVRKRLEIEAAGKDADRRRNEIANFLVSNVSFEIPLAAYERGVQAALDNLIEQALRAGQSREQIEEQRDSLLENTRKYVLGDMRLRFIIRKLVDILKIEVSNAEYNAVINNFIAENRMDNKQADELLKRERQTHRLLSQALRVKTLDALVAKASKTLIAP